MARDFLNTIRLPRVAALPGTANAGDCVVLVDGSPLDGITHVYNGTTWVPLGVSSQQLGGFISEDVANYYELSAAAAMPGADDFIAVALAVPLANRNGAGWEPIFSKIDATFTSGWYLAWAYGQIEGYVICNAGSIQVAAPVGNYDANALRGHLVCVGLRVYEVAGNINAELWVGPAMIVGPTTTSAPMLPNTTDQGRALGSSYGAAAASNAIFAGIGYRAGTVTNAQMRTIMGRCVAQGAIPEDVVAWTSVYQGQDVKTAPATWTPSVGTGTMAEVGTCEGVEGFFPPGAAGNNVIVAAGGAGGLDNYAVRKRIAVLTRGGR